MALIAAPQEDETMSKLGTSQKPLVLRVRTPERAEEVAARCDKMNVKFILGIEEDKAEDLRDLERYVKKSKPNSLWTLR